LAIDLFAKGVTPQKTPGRKCLDEFLVARFGYMEPILATRE